MSRIAKTPLAALATALLLAPALLLAQAKDWKDIPTPALKSFTIAKPTRIALPNGMVILLMEDHELPLINASALVRGGLRDDPAEKTGLSSVAAQVWRTGGTKSKTGDELDDFLEARAAKVETSSGMGNSTASLSCLKGDFDSVLGVFDELLRSPEFREEKIPLAKNQLNTGIARRNDEPMGIAGREARKLGYGENSPYARVPEYATVAAISREDLLAWHRRNVHPDRIVMGVVGDFDAKEMEAKLRKTFGSWPKGPATSTAPAAYRKTPKPGVFFVEKDDVNQSSIHLVHLGIEKRDPDYFALEVMNEMFGGGFSSRLFSHVRSDKGLAYAVSGGVRNDWDYPGLFDVFLGTKSQTTATGIDALMTEIKGILEARPSADELKKAKDAILNSFVFRFDSKRKILLEQALDEFFGYPPDFLERYRNEIEKVTADDVLRVAKKHIRPADLAILVVGKSADFDKPLSTFGPVTKLDITIPPLPGEKKAAATDASRAAGKALLAKAAAAIGSAPMIAGVKDVATKGKAVMKTAQGEMELGVSSLIVFPDRIRHEMQTPMGSLTQVASSAGAFVVTAMGTQDLPGSQRDEMLKQVRRHPLFLGQKREDPKLSASTAGTEKIGEVSAQILDLSYDGLDVRWFLDPASGRLLRASYAGSGPGGPATVVVDYSDFRPVDGLTLPFQQEVSQNGQKIQTFKVEELRVNAGADPKAFEKPAPKPAS
ncbi:MAG: insulinase family protein [Thermoanaerobaculia bacterium]